MKGLVSSAQSRALFPPIIKRFLRVFIIEDGKGNPILQHEVHNNIYIPTLLPQYQRRRRAISFVYSLTSYSSQLSVFFCSSFRIHYVTCRCDLFPFSKSSIKLTKCNDWRFFIYQMAKILSVLCFKWMNVPKQKRRRISSQHFNQLMCVAIIPFSNNYVHASVPCLG